MRINGSSKRSKQKEDWQINFFSLDADIVEENENNPIAISIDINNYLVERILVDDGSAVKVLMYDAFKKMGLDESIFKLVGQFYDFSN